MLIRRAIVDDAKIISELSAVTFCDTFTGTCTESDMQQFIAAYFNYKQVLHELKDKNDFYFLLYLDEIPVGYIRIKEDESTVDIIKKHKSIELKRIYVLKQYHDQRLGAALMDFALKFAAENKYELVWLGVWEHNERAKKFYQKYGFIDSGIMHPFPIGSTPQTDLWWYKILN